ncbi:hypothetical protein AOQ84DRAFT_269042, partial [Glonium stellatum]
KPSSQADGPSKLIETPVHAQKPLGQSSNKDQFVNAASLMALAHNMILQGLNSICRHASQVFPKDYRAFIGYAYCRYQVIQAHHDCEETVLFPIIKQQAGGKGIMNENIEQHRAFKAGLEAYKLYLLFLSTAPQRFSRAHLDRIVDDLAPPLCEHPTRKTLYLLSLSR